MTIRNCKTCRAKHAEIKRLREVINRERKMTIQLAKLAADQPMFSNPLIVAEAKRYRDGVLQGAGLIR